MEVLEALRSDMAEVKRRTNAIENARVEARSSYDANWNDVKIRLERIEFQTTRTNGRVSMLETGMIELGKLVAELREWKSYMGGVAASFSWWKPALATISAAAVIYIAAQATS
jgi:exoribonuclease R